jgi:hypothetical protein
LEIVFRTSFIRLAKLCTALAVVGASLAQAQTIDFEGIGVIEGPPYDVVSQGYRVQYLVIPGNPEPGIRPAEISPNGTDVYQICGFCAASGGFNLFRENGATFNLESIDLGGLGNTADEFDFTITGYPVGRSEVVETLTVAVPEGMQTVAFDATWRNLTSVTVLVNNAGNVGFSASAYDNIVLANGPLAISIDVLPGDAANKVYPNKTGKLPVAVLSSAEFDATQVDPATMTFGLGEATPLEPLVISNVDGAFGPDATTKFQVAESGIFCDDTEVTLTGETYSGEPFAGTGEIDASDCQTGGCHPY